jgi:hypothetical protein
MGIKYNEAPTSDYMDKAFGLIKKRLAIGGYRLENEIIEIYKAYQEHRDKFEKESLLSSLLL